MNKKSNTTNVLQILPFAYGLMLLVIVVLPFFSVPEYDILKNTTSHLGAQSAPYAWVMNFTFILLGLGAIIDGWRFLGKFWFHKIAILVFGISLMLCAFFQHAPIVKIPFDPFEDQLHSWFATITGFSFTVFAISMSFILGQRTAKALAVLVGVLVTILSMLMFEVEQYMGIWQRIIFIMSFGWMIYIFNKAELQ
ncbi:DUF998 domain-containing protein [Sungkyunkwania multivorans]|uniref:DUF998 domain-containing protein n=1 Tax=Sungkyunkwania multivorans TaxID=1173618 RepID=A0ABW3D1R0_9FLAO